MSDEKGLPSSKGRGSLLLNLMRKREEERKLLHSVETPSQSSDPSRSFEGQSQSSTGSSSLGRGRAQLASLIKSQSSSSSESRDHVIVTHGAVGHGVAISERSHGTMGRGSLIGSLKNRAEADVLCTSSAAQAPLRSVDDGVLDVLTDLSVYDNPPSPEPPVEETRLISRQGKTGTRMNIFANYIDLEVEPGKGLFQYEVKYSPNIDSIALRRKLLNQHSVEIGKTRTFDGMILSLPEKLPNNVTTYNSDHPMDGSTVTLTIIYKKHQSMSENIQFFNTLFIRIMRALNLVRIGRQSFNPYCAHAINEHQLEVWPGYVTAVNEHEGGLKLCLDVKHRVLRKQTVWDIITNTIQKQRHNFRDWVVREIVGTSVLTRYNNKTYRVDDIDWDKTPEFKFSKNGEDISLLDYYKKFYNIQIRDTKQPLLVNRSMERTSTGERKEKMILLVPELAYATGLTDSMRSNYKIMKDLDAVTKVSPDKRVNEIKLFVEQMKTNSITNEILSGWGLRLANDVVKFTGRCLPPETIILGNNHMHQLQDRPTDWSNIVVRRPILRTPHLNKWYILYVNRDGKIVDDFLDMLQNIVKAIGMRVSHPYKIPLRDDRNESYLQEIRRNVDSGYELVVAVFPTNRTDRYSSLKRLCCVEKPIASQVIISKTISNANKLKSVTEKIALQINCKLGGALWTVNLPLKNCMVCGIDVYHSGIGSGPKRSVAGFVASLDTHLTKWHSRVCMQASKQELTDALQMCLISSINSYRKYNNVNPNRIIIYRDGVGDGDLEYVMKYEIKQLIEAFNRIGHDYKPQLSVIVVQKRINTRLFTSHRGELANPAAGTVVDSCVTRRNYYDFFLVPQNVRQGSVTPIHYIVIHDTSTIETDHMQRLTYKFCHLYYNWPGTIRVPAPCQYAHKLVYQVGQNLQTEPHRSLNDILYYL